MTAQLVAWNATQAPVVSHNSGYTIAPLGSKQFLSFDLKDTLAEAGVSTNDMNKYFMHLTVSGIVPILPFLTMLRHSLYHHTQLRCDGVASLSWPNQFQLPWQGAEMLIVC